MLLQKRLLPDWGIWIRIGAFILAFLLGYWSSNPSLLVQESNGSSHLVVPIPTDSQTPPLAVLEQSKAMREFQALVIQSQRHPSDCTRILELQIPDVPSFSSSGDSSTTIWIRSFEILARGLEVAFSTERRLKLVFPVHRSREKLCENPSNYLYCALDRWTPTCQERPRTALQQGMAAHASQQPQSTVRFGIEHNESQFFHTHYYGPASVARLPEPMPDSWPWTKSWLLDGGWSWERRWGAFWIRSQMIWFLWDVIWKGSIYYNSLSGVPHSVRVPSTKGCSQNTIGLVLDGDAQEAAMRQFARNNNKTYAWERIQTMAHHIRASHAENHDDVCAHHQGSIVSVTIPSSHSLLMDSYPASSMDTKAQLELIDWRPSTTKATSPKSSLSESEEMLEYLSSFPFLIGSFAGSWFRVATSLNLAHNIMERRFFVHEQRFWTLDIEWIKDL